MTDAAHLVMLWLTVHAPRGGEITVNVREISSLRKPEGTFFTPGTRCLVYMNNGRFFGTKEECRLIVRMLAQGDAP